jgi:hypothetical protein
MVKPKMVNTMAGTSSFVCRLVNVVHRDCNATGRDGYDAFILMLFGASLEVDRSLDRQIDGHSSNGKNAYHVRRYVLVVHQVTKYVS